MNINGTPGNDRIFGTEEEDFVFAGDGDDFVHGGGGNDRLDGGAGNDTLMGGDGDDEIFDGEGDDLVIGGAGNDFLHSWGGEDTLIGGAGNDQFHIDAWLSASGRDVVIGGDGADTLYFYAEGNVVVNLETQTASATQPNGDFFMVDLHSIEGYVHAGFGGAHITGSSGDDSLSGGGGNDTIISGAGNDTVSGNFFGDDLYIFNAAPGEENADLLTGFTRHEFEGFDTVVLDSSVMPELGAIGDFSAEDERFYAAADATGGAETDDRVVYDTDSGRLYYDADGSGEGEAQLLATVTTYELFTGFEAGDFAVI